MNGQLEPFERMLNFFERIARSVRTDANFLEQIARSVRTDANFFERIARSVQLDANFFERIARAVRTVSQPIRTANERLMNGYPFKNG